MKKYFKKNSNIEINFGDNVTFAKTGEVNGLNMSTKITGEVTEENIDNLVEMDLVEVKNVEQPCCCGSDFDLDKIRDLEDPLKELDTTLEKLEKVVEILSKLTK